jgi:hypothetical protein
VEARGGRGAGVKKVVLFAASGNVLSATPVAVVARLNGIPAKHVPALLNAWYEMGAIRPRPAGGFTRLKHVAPRDPAALKIVADRPNAPAPRPAPGARR